MLWQQAIKITANKFHSGEGGGIDVDGNIYHYNSDMCNRMDD